MNLSNEEKKRIADSATLMMQAFCEFRLAEDRLNTMSSLSGTLLKMKLDKETLSSAMSPYVEKLRRAQIDFFESLEIGQDNKEFWEYNARIEKERQASSQMGGEPKN